MVGSVMGVYFFLSLTLTIISTSAWSELKNIFGLASTFLMIFYQVKL